MSLTNEQALEFAKLLGGHNKLKMELEKLQKEKGVEILAIRARYNYNAMRIEINALDASYESLIEEKLLALEQAKANLKTLLEV